jgi:hypothetical protein
MGDTIDDQEQPTTIEPGAAGAPEGAVSEPSTDQIAELYKATGVKAPVPTGKPKGRPKTADGGDKKDSKKDDASGAAGKGQADDDGKDKSKTTSASDSDGSDGDDADASGKKVSSKDRKDGEKDSKISGDSDEDAEGVSKAKSSDNKEASKSGKDDDQQRDNAAGKEDGESGAATKEDEGKRPGKSNPEVEKRFQKLTGEVKERDQVIADLQKKLQEKDQLVEQTKIAQEDPEYTIEDFRKVRDSEGNIIDLDPERAELAWRRWKDGYDGRAAEREAKANHAAAEAEREAEMTREVMEKSVKAYDALATLMDDYPELVSDSGKFDEVFAAKAMPIIQESIEYLPGTEPGNAEEKTPVIVGLKIDPKKILDALKGISEEKRSLPLNGVNDSVETRSNVSVPHSRSSDPTVHAANELYAELGIKKRI